MSKIVDALKQVLADAKAAYQAEPVRINGYVTGILLTAGVPVAIAGVPVATVVAVALGAVLFTEGTRARVFAPANVTQPRVKKRKAVAKKRR